MRYRLAALLVMVGGLGYLAYPKVASLTLVYRACQLLGDQPGATTASREQRAEQLLIRAVRIDPHNWRVRYMLAQVMGGRAWRLLEAGKVSAGIALTRRALGYAPQDSVGYRALGTMYERAGDLRAAEGAYRRSLQLARAGLGPGVLIGCVPEDPWQQVVVVLAKQGRTQEAERELRALLRSHVLTARQRTRLEEAVREARRRQ